MDRLTKLPASREKQREKNRERIAFDDLKLKGSTDKHIDEHIAKMDAYLRQTSTPFPKESKQLLDNERLMNYKKKWNVTPEKMMRLLSARRRVVLERKYGRGDGLSTQKHRRTEEKLTEEPVPEDFLQKILPTTLQKAPMPPDLTKSILRNIPNVFRRKYPKIVDAVSRDIEEHFVEMNHHARLVAKLRSFSEGSKSQGWNFRFDGRTENYGEFLRRRRMLERKLGITWSLARRVLDKWTTTTPVLLNFQDLSRDKHVRPSLLMDRITMELWRGKNDVTPFLDLLRDEADVYCRSRGAKMSLETWTRKMKSVKVLIEVNVRGLLLDGLQRVVGCFNDADMVPYFNFRVVLRWREKPHLKSTHVFSNSHNSCSLQPTFTDVKNFYTTLIDQCCHYDHDLNLGTYNDHVNFQTIHVQIDEETRAKFSETIREKLAENYQPLLDHIDALQDSFGIIINDQREEIREFLTSTNATFDDLFAQVVRLKDLQLAVIDLNMVEYFRNFSLDQKDVKMVVRGKINDLLSAFTKRLIVQNEIDNSKICRKFEDLVERLLNIPDRTEELVELEAYVLWVKVAYLKELEADIRKALNDVIVLNELTQLPARNVDVNSGTLLWLERIKPVLERHNYLFEQKKMDLQDQLNEAIAKLDAGIQNFWPKLEIFNEMVNFDEAKEYRNELRKMAAEWRGYEELLAWINKEEALLKIPFTSTPDLYEIQGILFPFYELIYLCCKWITHHTVWMIGPWEKLNHPAIDTLVEDYYREFVKTSRTYKNLIRQQILEKYPRRLKGQLDEKNDVELPSCIKLCNTGLQYIKDFRPALHHIQILCNPDLLQRHWDMMAEVYDEDITPNYGTSLTEMVEKNFPAAMLEEFEMISTAATKERILQENYHAMLNEWQDLTFSTTTWKETDLKILSSLDDVQVILDDHVMKTLLMRGSAYVKPIEQEVRDWYALIRRMNSAVNEVGRVQAQWLYLLPIFSAKDIAAQMVDESELYEEVTEVYRGFMDALEEDPKILIRAGATNALESMIEANEKLERINEGVSDYLEKKRLYFPRFFFLSNDEMFEILSETKDPLRVQPHLSKCFEGIQRLEFDQDLVIHGMHSRENEYVKFLATIDTVEAKGGVEKWLLQVEGQMVESIKHWIRESLVDYEKRKRIEWIMRWQGQVVLCVSQIFWTATAEECLRGGGERLKEMHDALNQQLLDVVSVIRSPTLTTLQRITIKALIVIDVHAKDVIWELVGKRIVDVKDFQWLAQLRYYWTDTTIVRIINASIHYAHEYLGNSDRLVITPLTDRCYRTLMGAYQLHLNGAPEGPAGTGKTETTKDLAKTIAKQCVVFNCSEGLDYKAMGKFFKGLASTGAWACFDEFNRIELEVLSVIAQQILGIINAVRSGQSKFLFEGTELELNPTCYICITMNPGYAGRSELPDNLKVLFRTVAMMVPDYAMIAEISLYSYGFHSARTLAVKIVSVYQLCSEQLSSQNHYDYGMRAVKTVISACGNLKRKYPDTREDTLLLQAIVDVNQPKFLAQDIVLFRGIVSDLFPGVESLNLNYEWLEKVVVQVCNRHKLIPDDYFLRKIIEVYEMMLVRHGFMLVGEPFGGKTTILHVLAEVLSDISTQNAQESAVDYETINPKAVTITQLYGAFDAVSYEWTDGIIANCFRAFAKDTTDRRKWIVFDGPIDAVWIENMNTVLDDNKKLCLMSGEVIAMTDKMSMIFEVMDLTQASPATVSRCGMIYVDTHAFGWTPLLNSWLQTDLNIWLPNNQPLTSQLLMWLLPPTLHFIHKHCTLLANPGPGNLLNSTLNLVEMLMNKAINRSETPADPKHFPAWIVASVLVGVVWGVGGCIDAPSRLKFDEFYKALWKQEVEAIKRPEEVARVDFVLPGDGMYFDYVYVYRSRGSWKYLPDDIKTLGDVPSVENLSEYVVPTIDTARYMRILSLHVHAKKPVLFVGPTGTGKSFYVQNVLMKHLDKDRFEPSFLTFSVQITANEVQDLIISKLYKRGKGRYGPGKGKHSVMFIDDLNLPSKETYGAQPPIELLRQFMDHRCWYDLKDTTKIRLDDVLFVAAMGLVGGSRQEIYPRFLRHFNIYSINEFTDDTIGKIFQNKLLLTLLANGFGSDILITVTALINATVDVYRSSVDELRPTPNKSHYIFNLRDVSRMIQGCGLIRKDPNINQKSVLAKVWIHEALRVFYDRLVDVADKQWCFEKIKQTVRTYFKVSADTLLGALTAEKTVREPDVKNLLFGTYLDLDSLKENRKYEEVGSLRAVFDVSSTILDEYNAIHKSKIDIVLFDYAVEHLSKICRIVALPGGNGLLVGIGGSGRQSLVRLVAAMYGVQIFQPQITKNYGKNEWRANLKTVLKEAGAFGKEVVFLFNETQVNDEIFLQDLDSLLNTGEVPNLYEIDEKQEILDLTRSHSRNKSAVRDLGPLELFQRFVGQCKVNLHIMICFSSIGSSLRTRLRYYPSLVNCCTIDWFEDWPEDALRVVAERVINANIDADMKRKVIVAFQTFHTSTRVIAERFYEESGRRTYITTASYLNLINNYTRLINKKQEEVVERKTRYLTGLDRLAFAAEQVHVMQDELNTLKPKLENMARNCEDMLRTIEKETTNVEMTSCLVKQDEETASVQADQAQKIKDECEKDLATVLPIFNEAVAALDTLKPDDIILVKAMKNPPEIIKKVLTAVCILKAIPPKRVRDMATGKMTEDYWNPSLKLLSDIGFLQSLKDFDKDHIPERNIALVRRDFIADPRFEPHVVAKASSAAEGLCKWVKAMDLYDKVARTVAPKKERLAEAEAQLAATMALLADKQNRLRELERELARLEGHLNAARMEMGGTQNEVELCSTKLTRAEMLIDGLGGERTRWKWAVKLLDDAYVTLAGDVLLSCGIVAYLAPYNLQFREEMIDDWYRLLVSLAIPVSESYSFADTVASPIVVQKWYICGLPNDRFSTDNALIMHTSNKYPLFIDPQTQAVRWIKTLEKENHLVVVKMSRDYMKRMEMCLEQGVPVLVEGVMDTVETALDPILARNTFRQGGVDYIAIGDNLMAFNAGFRLYLATALRNPMYSPEVYNKVTVINFALTLEGLVDQLLGITVAKERPDLQEQRDQLIVEDAENRRKLNDIEESILRTLSETQGNILEDETAVMILRSSKVVSEEIQQKQALAVDTQELIEKSRLSYRPIANHGGILYFTVSDLANIDPMYQFSLTWYINLYVASMRKAAKSEDLGVRIGNLRSTFTYELYANVCQSLFDKDKLLYSFVLYTKILMHDGALTLETFRFLLTGGGETKQPNPFTWLSIRAWNDLCALNEIEGFQGILKNITNNQSTWRTIHDTNIHLTTPIPIEMTALKKLILLRTIRPDKTTQLIAEIIANEMGDKFTHPPIFNITKSHADSIATNPLVFILSPGSDPVTDLTKLSEKMAIKLTMVSLGQGQGPIAERLIRDAQRDEHWVCLQNCHLAASWMPELERICDTFDKDTTTPDFRLWLTSYPSTAFPIAVLQNAIKMTNETSQGLQANLLRLYTTEPVNDAAFYDGLNDAEKRRAFQKLLYGLGFFHGVIQERIKFGAIGWNIPYGFNESDFQISVQQMRLFVDEQDRVPFDAITYLTGECNYGGRVTDDWDRRLIATLLDAFINVRVVREDSFDFCPTVGAVRASPYVLPSNLARERVVEHISETLPQFHSPEVFGLNVNAGIARDVRKSTELLASVLALDGARDRLDRHVDARLLDICAGILDGLPLEFDEAEARVMFPVVYGESMNTVLVQEVGRFNRLLRCVRESLERLVKAVRGYVIITAELETLATSLLNGKIPTLWSHVSYSSLKPLPSYISDFRARLAFFQTWLDHGKPASFWISGFFFTQAFLTAAKQNYARKYTIPIDQLTFDFDVDPTHRDDAFDGVFTYGLFLEGARWADGVLQEQIAKVLYESFPAVWFRPCTVTGLIVSGRYKCPLYKTLERRGVLSTTGHSTNYVLPILVRTERDVAHWVKRSVALFCQLSD